MSSQKKLSGLPSRNQTGEAVYNCNADLSSGWLKADNTLYDQSSYPELYSAIGLQTSYKNSLITITARTSGTASNIYALTYGNGLYVYAGGGGVLATSTDAITWTARTSGVVTELYALTYGNGLYVYGGAGGVLRTSTDAITWTARTSGTAGIIYALTYGNGLYVYAGGGGALATSTDAITWTARTSGTAGNIYALTYGNGLYVYGNASGTIGTSSNAITWSVQQPRSMNEIQNGNIFGSLRTLCYNSYYNIFAFGTGLNVKANGGIGLSYDNGVNWFDADSSLYNNPDTVSLYTFKDLFFYVVDTGGTSSKLYCTSDLKTSFVVGSISSSKQPFVFTSTNNLIVVSGGGTGNIHTINTFGYDISTKFQIKQQAPSMFDPFFSANSTHYIRAR